MSFDHLQVPATAGRIFNRVGMTALCRLLRILLCFEVVPPPNLLFFTFVFVLPRPSPFFCGLRVSELDIFFSVGKFLSDIWSGTLAFFVGHFEKMSDCPSPTNFDSTANVCPLKKAFQTSGLTSKILEIKILDISLICNQCFRNFQWS